MMDHAAGSIEQAESYKRRRDEEVAKHQGELNRERASREEAWTTLEGEHRVHEEVLLSKKAAFDAALRRKRD